MYVCVYIYIYIYICIYIYIYIYICVWKKPCQNFHAPAKNLCAENLGLLYLGLRSVLMISIRKTSNRGSQKHRLCSLQQHAFWKFKSPRVWAHFSRLNFWKLTLCTTGHPPRVWLKHIIDLRRWNSQVHRQFPRHSVSEILSWRMDY